MGVPYTGSRRQLPPSPALHAYLCCVGCTQVVAACMTLTAPGGKVPKDLSWAAGKKFMGNVDAFLKSLLNFDKDNVPVNCADVCEKEYISNPSFNADNIRSKSSAAAGLCAWVVNICKYFRIYQVCLCVCVLVQKCRVLLVADRSQQQCFRCCQVASRCWQCT